MHNQDILDDFREQPQKEYTETYRQMLLGVLAASVIQYFIWHLFFSLSDRMMVSNFGGFNIPYFNIRVELFYGIIWVSMLVGNMAFLALTQSKNQPNNRILLFGFGFNILSVLLLLSIIVFIEEGGSWKDYLSTIMRDYKTIPLVAMMQYAILVGLLFLLRRRLWYIGLFFLVLGFILLITIEV